LETVVDGIITIDANGLIQTANPAAESIFGYTAEELKDQNVKMLMPEPYAAEHDGYLHNYLSTGDRKVIGIGREVTGKHKEGSTFPMELAVSEMEVNGERMFTGIVRDISERKRVESEIHDREQRIGTLIDTIVDGIIVIDSKGAIQTFNPAAESLFGYHSGEVQGRNINILMPKPYAAEHDGYLHNYLTTGTKKIIGIGREVTGRRKDGSTFPMELAVSEMEVKGERMFTGIVRDISERKEAEAALAEKTHALEVTAAFERSQSQVMALFSSNFDTTEVFQLVLGVLADIHGFPVSAVYLLDEWNGMLKCVASRGMPEDSSRELKSGSGLIGQVAMDGKPIILSAPEDMPFRIDTGLFPVVPAAVVASPVIYGEKVLGVLALSSMQPFSVNELGFIERLTDQMGISLNNLNQYHDLKALSEQYKQRGSEISQKNRQLEQANRLKTEFLANMSHELRTPLNAIIGFSEVLKDELLGKLNDEQADYMNEIFGSANHLLSLINDILDLSKIEAGKMELYLGPVNVSELLQNALSVVKEKAHNHHISLALDVGDDIGLMQVDGRKLKQIVYNLLSNAVKFTPDGGQVAVEARHVEGNLLVKVTDTGIGIAQDNVDLLFRPFEQLDGSLARQFEGTGLGLAMVKRLVELHGGEVSVSSQEGKGSCFQFAIPYRDENEVELSATVPVEIADDQPVPQSLSGRPQWSGDMPVIQPEVLLVEDNDQAAELMAVQLRGAGYVTHRASNGVEGLKLAETQQPNLIIMDILLPDINGWEIMRRMKQDSKMQDIPIVVVSIVADSKKGIELGAVEVMQKPVHKLALLEAIGRVLPVKMGEAPARILVVDDEEKSVRFMVRQLEDEGFRTISAYGGQQAIDIVNNESPDLVILDLMMPEVSGFDVVRTLRQEASTHDIPIIILTAKLLTDEDRNWLDEHVTRVVDKSEFDTEQFLADVQQALPLFTKAAQPGDSMNGKSLPLVLVVEDDSSQAELVKLYLEDSGCRVVLVGNGREALEQMQNEPPDLITLDLMMPEMDGFAFLEAKANLSGYSSIPVMVLSSVAERMEGSPLAADAVLNKPVRRAELLSLLDKLLPSWHNQDGVLPQVLLVDDDPKAIKIVTSYLPDERYEIISAFGGEDGIELAKAERPDLIILDLMMPDVSGFEVLTALKDDENTRQIPVIVLTAKLLSEQERQCLQKQVALIAEKGKASSYMLTGEIERVLRRYQKK